MDSSQTLRSSSHISQKHHHSETFHHNNHHYHQAMKYPSYSSSRRTQSFSSSSSSLSSSSSSMSYNPKYNDSVLDNSLLSTPDSTPVRISGKPFSWEYFPGIPKIRQLSKKKLQESSSTNKLLPLPPLNKKLLINLEETNGISFRVKKSSTNSSTTTTNSNNPNYKQQRGYLFESDDPFFAALVECSKDDTGGDDDHEDSGTSGARFWSIASAKVSRSLSDRFGFVNLYASCKRTCAVAESIRHLPRSARSPNYDLINGRSLS